MRTLSYKILSLCFCIMLLAQACKKDKIDTKVDNRILTENRVNSNVRIINLAGFNQVVANGDSLTSFIVRPSTGPDSYKYPGTSYFPTDGRLGQTWSVPQNLFNQQETATLKFGVRNINETNGNFDISMVAKNDYNTPTDYVLMPTRYTNGQSEVVAIPRGVASPSKPDHFKIRIVNLSANINNPAYGLSGPQEDLRGPVSLAFADGTLVNNATNNITAAAKVSEYVELPYGTYQFRVLLQDGKQLPSPGSSEDYSLGLIDPATSSIPKDYYKVSHQVYAPIQTYQPGGVYTILVAPQRFDYLVDDIGNNSFLYQNAFRVITDVSAPANQTYFRLQAANAMAGQVMGLKVNGKLIASHISYGNGSDYANLIKGNYTVEALDASGNVLASSTQELRPSQNYTAWLHPDQTGKAKLLLVANDLSGTSFRGPTDDATYARQAKKFFFSKRFLNLSIGNPYITFTFDNGQYNSNAVVNIQPGLPVFEQPYIGGFATGDAYNILAYRSKPNVVPGTWANDIETLPHDVFIANKTLYQKPNKGLPVDEPGVYTVALIGTSTNATSANKAKMIIIKHTK